MKPWPLILGGLIALVGPVIDRFLLRRQKGFLYYALLRAWNTLDNTRVPDLPRLMATALVGSGTAFGSAPLSVRIAFTLASSFALTTVGIVGPTTYYGLNDAPLTVYDFWDVDILWYLTRITAVNLPFDLATVWATLRALRAVQHAPPFRAITLLIGVGVLAWVLAVACLLALTTIGYPLYGYRPDRLVNNAIELVLLGRRPIAFQEDGDLVGRLAASTTLVPTLIGITILLVLFVAKAFVEIGRRLIMYFFEVATEGEPSQLIVFTLLSSIVGLLVAIASAFIELRFGSA